VRIACISLFGGFSPIMERIEREIGGNNCLTCYYNKPYEKWWDGLISKAELQYNRGVAVNLEKELYKFNPDFIIFDMTGEGNLADKLSKAYPVIGATEFCDYLEMNRSYGFDVMSTLGFNMPGMQKVKSYGEAMAFLKSRNNEEERWVIKFNDNQGNFSSYCSEDIRDMREELEHFNDSNIVDFSRGAIFQEFVEGIEISCEGWFDGAKFVEDGFNYTFEEKKFLTGNHGPSTGCEGNLVIKADNRDSIPKSLLRMTMLLKMYNYVGPFDINSMACTKGHHYEGFEPLQEGKAYCLEPTPRFGYDAFFALAEGLKIPLSEFFARLLMKDLDEVPLDDQYLMAVRVSIPPYPFTDLGQSRDKQMEKLAKKTMKYMQRTTEGTIVRVKDIRSLEHIYLQDIRLEPKKSRLVMNGIDSVVGVVTAKRYVLESAIEDVYKIVKQIDVPNEQYRLDIGKRAFKELQKLDDMKILKHDSKSLFRRREAPQESQKERTYQEESALLSVQTRSPSLETSVLSANHHIQED
jgi:phosphoribosylamine-glycine ligase